MADWEALAQVDWLRHCWNFALVARSVGMTFWWEVRAENVVVASFRTEAEAREWAEQARPCCLAELIAARPTLHPAQAIIDAGGRRLGRIRPELWGAYDALLVGGADGKMTALSAKARAAFPDKAAVFVRVSRIAERR